MSDPISEANTPLEWPPQFPPTDPWERFFIGVRWLGPDLSFFKDLSKRQAARSPESMEVWGKDPRRREIVSVACTAFKRLGWTKPYFLPNDRFKVIAYGPRFDFVDYLDFVAVLSDIERHLHIKPPTAFWESVLEGTLDEAIAKILNTCGDGVP